MSIHDGDPIPLKHAITAAQHEALRVAIESEQERLEGARLSRITIAPVAPRLQNMIDAVAFEILIGAPPGPHHDWTVTLIVLKDGRVASSVSNRQAD